MSRFVTDDNTQINLTLSECLFELFDPTMKKCYMKCNYICVRYMSYNYVI